jgi:hypothetical protein
MDQQSCLSIKESFTRYFLNEVAVTRLRDSCVFTLPIKTLDQRYPDVFIEKKFEDSFLVHDAGTTVAQLYAQGIHVTERRASSLEAIAHRFGAEYADERFQRLSAARDLESSVLAIAECELMGMHEILEHNPVLEQDSIDVRVKQALELWRPPYIRDIQSRLKVKGKKANHSFDFVTFPTDSQHKSTALQILKPSSSPQAQAERYGFLALDIEGTIYEDWNRFAIITKAEQWTKGPRSLVRTLSTKTIEVRTGEEDSLGEIIPSVMDEFDQAA